MATVTSSFQSMAQINSAVSILNSGYSTDELMDLSDTVFDRIFELEVSSYTETPQKISLWFSNGDAAFIYGSNLTGYTPYINKIEYIFVEGVNLVVNCAISVSGTGYVSGLISQASLSDSQHNTISFYGNLTIDEYGSGGSISTVTWDVGGVHLEINGSFSEYDENVNSATLAYNGMSTQASGLDVDLAIFETGSGEEIMQAILAGNDLVTGNGASVSLFGFSGSDTLVGSAGNDTLDGGAGNDSLEGVVGLDTAAFSGTKDDYTVTLTDSGRTVNDNYGTDGTDHLTDIERLEFSDKMVAFDIDDTAGQAYRIYQAAFNRTPDEGGLGFWIEQMDNGASLKQVASSFLVSSEFNAMYGSNPTNAQFVTLLYNNVLHRDPDAGGFNYWMNELENGMPREEALIGFSESFENKVALMAFDMDSNIGEGYRLYQAAFDRTPDLQGLNFWVNKINEGMGLNQVASHFIDSEEFEDLYGSNPTNEEFVDLLYDNVLHRDPDAGGYNYWVNQMESGLSREEVLVAFSESIENQLSLVGIVQDGIEYIGWEM